MITRSVLALLLCLTLCACAAPARQSDGPADDASADRQLLVMLRVAPPHFRPDSSYAGGYDSDVRRASQRRVAEGLASRYELTLVDGWPMPALGVDCFVMQARSRDSVLRTVDLLAGDPRVESAQAMSLFHVLSHNDPLFPLQPSAMLWRLDEVHKVTTGKRVRVAVVDTAVEIDHPDLSGQLVLERNLVDRRPGAAELHGTAVAGIIAARADDGVGIAGVAPESRLIALRACWQPGDAGARSVCSSFTLAKALQLAIDEKAEIVNLSIGGPRDRLLERLLDVAMSRGIIVVSAVDPSARDMGFPASHRGVLAVAGVGGQDVPPTVLLGPGRDIPSAIPGKKWGFVSGSSFAAAHVTGLVALLRELAPHVQSHQIQAALAPAVAPGARHDQRPMVDACAAIASIGGACACSCAVAGDTKAPAPP